MSMKQALGMMLASKMAGRGARVGVGLGGGLGGLAAAGILGGRRRGGGEFGRKVGLRALGYTAYRALQGHHAPARPEAAGLPWGPAAARPRTRLLAAGWEARSAASCSR